MSHYVKVTNILLVFHTLLNFLIGLLGVPATILYFIDYIIDTQTSAIGSDNIFITIYLFFMTIIQLMQAYLIITKTFIYCQHIQEWKNDKIFNAWVDMLWLS